MLLNQLGSLKTKTNTLVVKNDIHICYCRYITTTLVYYSISALVFQIMEQKRLTFTDEPIQPFSPRNKIHKRFKTEFSENQAEWFTTQQCIARKKNKSKKFTRFSEQTQNIQDFNKDKRINNFQNLLDWHKKFAPPKLLKENQNDLQLIQKHISSIPKKSQALHNRTKTQPHVYFGEYKKIRKRTAEIPMDRVSYTKCCDLVDDIYKKIAILKQIGYSDSKIDSWLLTFCEERKNFMKSIFMKNINYSIYSLKEEFQYQKQSKNVKDRIRFQIQKNKNTYNYVEIGQLSELSLYLQEILIQKNMKKAKEVQESILQKLSMEMIPKVKNDFCVFTKKQPAQVYNLLQELVSFEQKFGDFVSFSKISKLRFLQLTRVQKNLKNSYKQMLANQLKKIQRLNYSHNTIRIATIQE